MITYDSGVLRWVPVRTVGLYRLLLWCTIALSLAICLWGIWSIPLLSHNEGRRAVVVQEMLATGQWLIPTLNGGVYLAKPPFFYWVASIFCLVFQSTAEWVVRLPSALSALGVLWLMFHRVRKYIGEWPALFSVMVLLGAAKFTMLARLAEIEMLLVFCCTASMLFFLDYLKRPDSSGHLYLSYALLGLAFLTKGPVALVFFLPPLLLFWWVKRDGNIPKGLLSVRGWLIFSVLALPWYVYCLFYLRGDPMESVIQVDIFSKTFGTRKGDPVYEYIGVMAACFAPFLLLFVYRPRRYIRALFSQYETAFFGCWMLASFLIMSAFDAKHDKYIVPLFPAAAVFLGAWLANVQSDLLAGNRLKARNRMLAAIVVLLTGWAIYHTGVVPVVQRQHFSAIKPMMQKIREVKGDAALLFYEMSYPTLVYYYGTVIPVADKSRVQEMLRNGDRFLLIAESDTWEELKGENLCVVAEYSPFFHGDRSARLLGDMQFCTDGSNPPISRE